MEFDFLLLVARRISLVFKTCQWNLRLHSYLWPYYVSTCNKTNTIYCLRFVKNEMCTLWKQIISESAFQTGGGAIKENSC